MSSRRPYVSAGEVRGIPYDSSDLMTELLQKTFSIGSNILSRSRIYLDKAQEGVDAIRAVAKDAADFAGEINLYAIRKAGTALAVSLAAFAFVSFFDFGYDAYLNGAKVGTLASNDLSAAVNAVNAEMLKFNDGAGLLANGPDFFLRLVPKGRFTDNGSLLDNVRAATGETEDGYAIFLDGELICATRSYKDAQNAVSELSSEYVTENTTDRPVFRNELAIKRMFVPKSRIKERADAYAALANVEGVAVATTERLTDTVEIPFQVERIEDDGLYEGMEEVVEEGENGVKNIEMEVRKLNGAALEAFAVREVVEAPPRNRVVRVGTKERPPEVGTGNFILPYRGPLSSPFGGRWGRVHKGIDISGSIGDPVKAADNGRVTFAGVMDGFGNIVILDHRNGYQTYYAHLDGFESKVGDVVARGDVIARLGNTGRSTGPHVHFEIRKDGEPIDPLTMAK